MKTKLLLLVLFVLATTCAKGQQPRASGIPVPTVVQHNALSNTLRNFTITATNSIAELTVDATNDLYLLQTANLNGASNVLRTFTIDTATVQTAAINNASNVVYLFTITATNDASQVLRTLILAATNDLNTVLRALVTSATNGAASTAFSYTDAATNALSGVLRAFAASTTNDLNTVLRALVTTATNNNATTSRAYTDTATNALSGVLRIYTDSATNDLNAVLRALISSAGQWVSNSTSLWTPLNVGVKTNAPATALHVYGTARVEGPSAQILAPSGSQSLPGVSFAGDPDTGFWDGAPDTMYLIAGGQQIGAFDTTTVYLIKPLSFGIGGNSALLYGDSDGSIGQRATTKAQSNSIYRTYTDANNYSRLKHGYDTTKTAFFIRTEEAGTGIGNNPIQINAGPYAQVANLNLLTNGNVGIGNTAPVANLHIGADTGSPASKLIISGGGSGTSTATLNLGTRTRDWNLVTDGSPYTLHLDYIGTDAPLTNILTMLKGGNVGIRTNSPQTALHVYGSIRAEGPSAQILAPLGSVSLPGLSVAGDANTGFYGSDDVLRVSVGGVQTLATTPSGVYVYMPLLIGSSAATILIEDSSGSLGQRAGAVAQSNSIYRTYTDANNYSRLKSGYDTTKTAFFIRTEEAGTGIGNSPLMIQTTATNLVLTTNGNVGIGTTPMAHKLDVKGTSIFGTEPEIAVSLLSDSTGAKIGAYGRTAFANAPLIFLTGEGAGNTEKVRISPAGNLGVGTNGPATKLHVNGAVVIAPTNTINLTSDDTTVSTVGRSYLKISSDSAVSTDRTFILTAGSANGHILKIHWVGTNTGELVDDSAAVSGNHRLASTWTATQYDSVSLTWDGTDWIEDSRSTN